MAESTDERPASRWARVEALFDEAVEKPVAERASWVRASEPDPSLVAEVLGLLAAAERPGILDEPLALGTPKAESGAAVEKRVAAALAGRYRIERVLGHGGMATVFLAEEVKHARSVVLKVLRPEVARWIGAQRFLAEIRILARLSHPHIIGLIDSGDADGLLYYVMPYQGGMTLRERLAAGPVPTFEAIALLRDIATALGYAHAQGLVHRDLKPDNVLVVDGHAFLMDFGVAKLIDALEPSADTIEGIAVGTPAYMSPEQAAGSPVTARADVYAWGLVAREVFDASAGKPGPPPALAALVDVATRREAAERPADGAALVEALDRAARTSSRPPRWRLLAALVVVVGVAIAVLARGWSGIRLENVPGPVTVAPLRNETGDSTLTVWGRLAGDWLTQGLLETGRVAVVPWPVALQGAVAAEKAGGLTVAGLASETGAGTVVTGAFYLVGEKIQLQAQITDAATGTSLASIPPVEVPRAEIDRGVQALRDRVMGVLAIRTDQRFATTVGLTDRPPTYEAYRIFDRGMDAYNRQDYRAAAADLIAAWRADTVFIASLVYASRALWNTGDRAAADSLVREIRSHPAALGAYHELQVRYLEQVLAGDAVAALATIKAASAQAPGGRADYNVALAALSVGRPAEALAVLQGMDPDRGAMKGWAPFWFVYSHALHLEGKSEAELAAARELRRRHPESRAGWVHLVRAHASVGQTAAIDSILQAAGALPPDTYWSQGAMMVTAGEELDAHGFSAESRPYYQQAISWLANQLARDPNHRAHRYWMGSAHYDLGRFADAEPYFESLVRDYPGDLLFKAQLALLAARAGDTALATARLGSPPRYERGEFLSYQARLAAVTGDRERAVALWSEALASGMTAVAWIHAAGRRDLEPLLADPRFQRLGVLPRR